MPDVGISLYSQAAVDDQKKIFGPESLAAKLWLEFSLGKEDESSGFKYYYRLLGREDTWGNEALKKATELDRVEKLGLNVDWLDGLLAGRYVDWLIRPLALDLPDAGWVELAVDEWMGLRNTCRDLDGDILVRLVPLDRATNRAQEPFANCLTSADQETMLKSLDKNDPRILKAADVFWRWFQMPEHFRKASEVWRAIKGWCPAELTDSYPLHQDIPNKAPSLPRSPGKERSITDHITHAVREIGLIQERTLDTTLPIHIKGAELEYLIQSRAESALVAFVVPAINVEKVLNAGEPSLLSRLEGAVGRTVARGIWVDSVRDILDAAGLSPRTGLGGKQEY